MSFIYFSPGFDVPKHTPPAPNLSGAPVAPDAFLTAQNAADKTRFLGKRPEKKGVFKEKPKRKEKPTTLNSRRDQPAEFPKLKPSATPRPLGTDETMDPFKNESGANEAVKKEKPKIDRDGTMPFPTEPEKPATPTARRRDDTVNPFEQAPSAKKQ